MSKFLNDLDVRVIDDDAEGLWMVLAPLVYVSDVAEMTFTVPIGFKSDFCSVPHLPGLYEAVQGGAYRKSGTVHDYLYATHPVERAMADRVLREMLIIEGADTLTADAYYAAVRVGGEGHW